MRTFVLGLGAQKSGTTWVYSQISSLTGFKKPYAKEMHIFDAIHIDECVGFRRKTEARFSKALLKGEKHYSNRPVTKRMQMMLNQDEYFRYYDSIMNEDNCFSADITPSYSGLPVEVLREIKTEFERIAIEVRVIFLMREPVSRLESLVRMSARKRNIIDEISPEELMTEMIKRTNTPRDILRSSYRSTVNRIRSRFNEGEFYLGFYETMFEETELTKLGNFLGVDHNRFDAQKRVNHTPKTFKYPKKFLLDLRENYLDNYAFATEDLSLPRDVWDAALNKMSE